MYDSISRFAKPKVELPNRIAFGHIPVLIAQNNAKLNKFQHVGVELQSGVMERFLGWRRADRSNRYAWKLRVKTNKGKSCYKRLNLCEFVF